jgi:EPS-associated MarR family transcriptional regulator
LERETPTHVLNDDVRYNLLKLLEANPEASQRELARHLGLSLGKINYCLRALVQKGLVKAANFRDSKRKQGYIYKLTPRGIEEKARVTVRFLQRKTREYELLRTEIARLSAEVKAQRAAGGASTGDRGPLNERSNH